MHVCQAPDTKSLETVVLCMVMQKHPLTCKLLHASIYGNRANDSRSNYIDVDTCACGIGVMRMATSKVVTILAVLV